MKKELRPNPRRVAATSAGARSSRASARSRTWRRAASANRLRAVHRRAPITRAGSASPRTCDMPASARRPQQRRSLLGRMRRGATRARARRPREPAPEDGEDAGGDLRPTRRRRAACRARAATAAAPAARPRRAQGPAPRARGAHQRAGEGRARARAVQRLRAPAHDRRHRPHPRRPVGQRAARCTEAPSEVDDRGGLGAVLVPLPDRPRRRAATRSRCSTRARSSTS